ncbi:MAG: serine hydrolase domain-containing protein [Vicinamibacterales bacterium]
MRRTVVLAVLVGSLTVMGAAAPAPQAEPASELTRAVRAFAAAHDFSGTVLVARGDRILFHEAFGLANRAFDVPAALDTKYRIASITKLFTAVLVLQLQESGRLELDAPIARYLRDYPGEGADRITVRSLLHHTSGLRNFDQIGSYEEAATTGMEAYQLPHTPADLLRRYAAGPLLHEVGTTFDYNNGDYVILGAIIERLTGASYADALATRILGPLGLADTGLARQQDIVARLAPTYMRPEPSAPLINDMPVYIQNWWAAGGMYSTTTDLLAFARGLYGGKLLRPASLQALLTPGLDDYGCGLWVTSMDIGGRAHRFAQRPGRIMGANTLLLRYLDDDVTVVILGNTNLADTDAFGFLIGRTLLA